MKRVILVFLFINNITCILIPKQLLNIPENINFLSQNIAMFHPRDMEPEGRMTTVSHASLYTFNYGKKKN